MSQHDESKKNSKDLINKYFDGVLPIKDGKFTANLRQANDDIIFPSPNGELANFRKTEERHMHNTYGMTPPEMQDAIINYNKEKACLVDKNDIPVNVDYRLYNVTADKKLICRPEELMSTPFNHSSITRDGAIECAGHITIKEGIITEINDYSGHYIPMPLDLYNAICTIKKYGDNVFSKTCKVSMYDPDIKGGVTLTMPEFMEYMHETIPNAKGELVPRVAQMRIDRYDSNRAIVSVSHKFDRENGSSIEDIMNAQDIQYARGVKHLYTFPRDLFDKPFQDRHYQNLTVGMSDEYNASRSTITLNSAQLFDYLSNSPNRQIADNVIGKLLENGIEQDPKFIPTALQTQRLAETVKQELLDVAAPTMLNQHEARVQVSEQTTSPSQFDKMEVYQIRDLYNRNDPMIQSQIIDFASIYSPKSSEIYSQIIQSHNMYQVEDVKVVNKILTNMLGWASNERKSLEESKNMLQTNSYFVWFGQHCPDPQVKSQFFDKMGKLAVMAGVSFENLAKQNIGNDELRQLEQSYNLHKGLAEASHAMKRFTSVDNLSSAISAAKPTSRSRSQSL